MPKARPAVTERPRFIPNRKILTTLLWCTKLSHRYFCTHANLAADKINLFLSDFCLNGGACKHMSDTEQIFGKYID